jgi:hypothetical protein
MDRRSVIGRACLSALGAYCLGVVIVCAGICAQCAGCFPSPPQPPPVGNSAETVDGYRAWQALYTVVKLFWIAYYILLKGLFPFLLTDDLTQHALGTP